MKCPQCEAENVEGKRFCADCGSLLDTQLQTFIRSQVKECVQGQFKDQKYVEVETTEAIVARFQKWGKWFLVPTTILYTLLAAILALFGLSDYSKIHRAADEAVKEAIAAKTQALEAQDTSRQITLSMQTIADQINHADKITESKIASANKTIEGKMSTLNANMENANKKLDAQKNELATTSQEIATLVSTGEFSAFTLQSPNRTFHVQPFSGPKGAWLFMLLKRVPLFQTIQLQTGRSLEPKWTYKQEDNVIIFRWADPIDNLAGHEITVGYVPDNRYPTATYQSLFSKNGHVWAHGAGGDKEMPEFPSAHPNPSDD